MKELLKDLENVRPHDTDEFTRGKFYSFPRACGCPLTELAIQQDLMLRPITYYGGITPAQSQDRLSIEVCDKLAVAYNVTNVDLEEVYMTFDHNTEGVPASFVRLQYTIKVLRERYGV